MKPVWPSRAGSRSGIQRLAVYVVRHKHMGSTIRVRDNAGERRRRTAPVAIFCDLFHLPRMYVVYQYFPLEQVALTHVDYVRDYCWRDILCEKTPC